MKKQAVRWIVAGSLLVSSQLAAEPIEDLQMRLAGLRNDQPIRIEVNIEERHRGSGLLSLNRNKKHGRAVVASGPEGVKMVEQRWLGTGTGFSLWRSKKEDATKEMELISWDEAEELVDPAGMLDVLLSVSSVVSDEKVTWQGRPARFLVLRPLQRPAERKDEKASAKDDFQPFLLEARLWLDESGVPLALERSLELRLTAALTALQHESFTFQQVDGRLLVAEARDTYSGTALAVLRSRDAKKMKVTAVNPEEGR